MEEGKATHVPAFIAVQQDRGTPEAVQSALPDTTFQDVMSAPAESVQHKCCAPAARGRNSPTKSKDKINNIFFIKPPSE